MACPVCGSIETTACANTGRGEHFADPITRMTRYALDSRDDFWECGECASVFAWHDDSALTGSGNNDEETLTRLEVDVAKTIRSLAHAAGGATLPPAIRELLVLLARGDRTTTDRVVLEHVERLTGTPVETEESLALRREIARRPEELSLRQKWADLAERRGDVDRAQFVRAQLERRAKQRSSPAYRASVSSTETELSEAHPEWSQELAPFGVSSGTLSGGFVESVVIDAAILLASGRSIQERAPIRAVRLTGDVGLVAQLAKDGLLEHVCWLDLSGLRVDAGVLVVLATLSGLRALVLARSGITDALVETLWASFPRLLVCDLAGNPCADLVDKDLTYEEMSRYEWFATKRANQLATQLGRRGWIYPSSSPGDPSVDLEQLLAQIAKGW